VFTVKDFTISPLFLYCVLVPEPLSHQLKGCCRAGSLNIAPLHNQPLDKAPKAGHTHCKSRLTQMQMPSRHGRLPNRGSSCLFLSVNSEYCTTPFLSSSSSASSSSSSSSGWHPSCYCQGDAVGSLSAQSDNNKSPMASSRAKKTHDGPGCALSGNLRGGGASSEAGCSLVHVCERERVLCEGEWEREGGKDTPPCLVEIKGAQSVRVD